jgi:hypothetical protein
MGKVFAIAVIVGLIWVGLTVFTEGTDAVFGWLDWDTVEEAVGPAPLERFRAKGQSVHDAAIDRVERQLPPDPQPED